MSNMEIEQVLAQMRILAAQAGNKSQETNSSGDFSAMLKQSIDTVNDTQQQAGKLAAAFERGETEASLSEVMISLAKANVSFQAMVQVRNKLVEAYHDVMNMPM
ncbi:MAG: flagellar hook-basal body complex protein FliE [Pseudomonadota bacterium]